MLNRQDVTMPLDAPVAVNSSRNKSESRELTEANFDQTEATDVSDLLYSSSLQRTTETIPLT